MKRRRKEFDVLATAIRTDNVVATGMRFRAEDHVAAAALLAAAILGKAIRKPIRKFATALYFVRSPWRMNPGQTSGSRIKSAIVSVMSARPSVIPAGCLWKSRGKRSVAFANASLAAADAVYTLDNGRCRNAIERGFEFVAGFFGQTIAVRRVALGTLVALLVSLANFVDIVHWRAVAQPQGIVAHLKAPTAIRPVLGDVGQALVIKANQLFQVFVPSQYIRLDPLLIARVGENRPSGC